MLGVSLHPFWRYYGSKWRAVKAGHYPQPLHRTIIEPFAGSAGYSLHYPDRRVILVERYAVLAEMWRWIIGAPAGEIRMVPLVDSVDDLPQSVSAGARALVGFSMNAATSSPRRTISKAALDLRSRGRKFYGWTAELRERVASQAEMIRHWVIIEGDYTAAPDIEATWFVDSPYAEQGGHYVHGSDGIDYAALADWCQRRRGQPIVCEHPSATWLPFRRIGALKSGPRTGSSEEAVWP